MTTYQSLNGLSPSEAISPSSHLLSGMMLKKICLSRKSMMSPQDSTESKAFSLQETALQRTRLAFDLRSHRPMVWNMSAWCTLHLTKNKNYVSYRLSLEFF